MELPPLLLWGAPPSGWPFTNWPIGGSGTVCLSNASANQGLRAPLLCKHPALTHLQYRSPLSSLGLVLSSRLPPSSSKNKASLRGESVL